ncbi:MAG: FG-GAP repeat domain-containing protein [Thermoplasmatota archaeon]
MSRGLPALFAAILLAAAVSGCIKLPTSSGGDGASGGTNDFGWKGSAGFGGKVSVATPRLQVALGNPTATGLDGWTPPFDSKPKAADLDGDGRSEIVALGNDSKVYVFDSASGRVLATLQTTLIPGWYIDHVLNGVEAGVLRPGEPMSLVVANSAAHVAAFRFVPGGSSTTAFEFEKVWERRLNGCNPQPSMDSKPVLADADGDGALEIFLQTEEVGIFALRSDGTTLWKQCWAGGNADPLVDDLDGDGRLEAIFAADDGYLAVLDAAKGSVKWTFDATSVGVSPGSISVAPTVAELDGTAPKEIVLTARNAPSSDPAQYTSNHMAIIAVHASEATGWEGQTLWVRQPDWAHPLSYTHILARDVDGDGRTDLFGMDWNTIGHFPGNWERLGDAHVFRLDSDGNDVWVRSIETWWSNKDIALADANGDGELDVLANGPYVGQDGIWILSAESGEPGAFLPAGGWKVLRGPQLLDLSGAGQVQLVLPVEPVDPGDRRGSILVVDLGVDFDPAWAGGA